MIRKITSLTKIFLKDISKNFKIFNKKQNKIKDSNLFWMVVIIAIAIAFISYQAIDVFNKIGQAKIFLVLYLIFLAVLLLFQIILTALNVLFYSKDLEYILPMPVSSIELLLSRYFVLLAITYIIEAIFAFIPLFIYGLMTHISFLYFLVMPIVLIIFPALFVTIISTLIILLTKIFSFIKNKNISQTVITTILIILIFLSESSMMNNLSNNNLTDEELQGKSQEEIQGIVIDEYKKIGEGFLVVNPSIEILSAPNQLGNVLLNFIKLIIYNFVALFIFLLIGKNIYLKSVLKGITNIVSKKKQNIEIKYERKNKKIMRAYIEKDFKQLFRTPTFFMQLIFPVLIILISAIIICSVIIPLVDSKIQEEETISIALKNIEFDTTMVCVILGGLQVLFSMSGISLTAISREGRSAIYLKYIPVDLYKQFWYKNALQIIFNFIISIIVLGIIYFLISNISIVQILLIFAISIFINLINSFFMLIVDLKRPILNWDSEYQITKNSPNKIFQYAFMIIMVLVLMYFAKILEKINIIYALGIQLIIFMIIFFIINILVKRNINKLFSKVN